MDKKIKVIKRDGKAEDFDPEKIARVAQAAGLRPIDAEEVSQKVLEWAEKQEKKELSSLAVRDKVFQELEKVDKYASGLYAWYQSTKEK